MVTTKKSDNASPTDKMVDQDIFALYSGAAVSQPQGRTESTKGKSLFDI